MPVCRFPAINHGRPLVLIDACEETPTFDTVNFPNEDGARAAVQHLIECGCHRIAIVGDGYSPRTELAHVESSSGLRLRGASGALLDAGLPYDESTNFIGYGSDSGIEAGHAIAEAMLEARAQSADDTAESPFPGHHAGQREAPRPSMASSALTTMPHSE